MNIINRKIKIMKKIISLLNYSWFAKQLINETKKNILLDCGYYKFN
jgi:hypothetical protein